MTDAGVDQTGPVTGRWRRLSPWSMVQLGLRSIVTQIRAVIVAAPATLGALSADRPMLAWLFPGIVIVLVLSSTVLGYVFYRFRVLEDSVQVRQGAIRRKQLDLAFDRIQNISIDEPVYYRLLGLVTLRIDGAGSSGDEVRITGIERTLAESIRSFIRDHMTASAGTTAANAGTASHTQPGTDGELFYTRSLQDLIVHGLTNNRAFVAIAGILAFVSQANISPAALLARLGIDFDVVIAGLSMTRLILLFALSFLLVTGVFALLSVLVSVVVNYGFSLYRTDRNLVARRGLLSRHEVQIEKSRIQSMALRQDWLDRVLGRCDILLEPVSHSLSRGGGASGSMGKRILVPSARVGETSVVTDEILRVRIAELIFTPASRRLFKKRAVIVSLIYVTGILAWSLASGPAWVLGLVLALWTAHTGLVFLSCRRKGLAIDGDTIVVRSGVIGVNYSIFSSRKLQVVTHRQSWLMRRKGLSTLMFQTASTVARAPYLDSRFARSVMDYALYRAETSDSLKL